jgi:hypothetical protein
MRPENSDHSRTGLAPTAATVTGTGAGAAATGASPAWPRQAAKLRPPASANNATPRKARFFNELALPMAWASAVNFAEFSGSAM